MGCHLSIGIKGDNPSRSIVPHKKNSTPTQDSATSPVFTMFTKSKKPKSSDEEFKPAPPELYSPGFQLFTKSKKQIQPQNSDKEYKPDEEMTMQDV